MRKYVIFDFDGTVADTKLGIINAARYALNKLNITDTEDNLKRFVGPSLWYSFPTFYNLSESDTVLAVKYYREYYKPKGIYEAQLYNGMKELLGALKDNGFILGIASAKVEESVVEALNFMGVVDYFDVVVGSKPDGADSEKDELIKLTMSKLGCNAENTVYIGDSITDYYGAEKVGVDFIAAVYDRALSEFDGATINKFAYTVEELKGLLIGEDKKNKAFISISTLKNALESIKDLGIGNIPENVNARHSRNNVYALALSGGGSRGAYEVGAWKALNDMGIKIIAVTGTSIGAINGALIAQDDFETALKSWCEITPEMVFDTEKAGIERFRDTSKIKEILSSKIDEEKIRAGKIRLGLISFNITEMKGDVKFIEDIPQGELVDYVMASSNHPLFDRQIIDKNIYIDGGVYDNLPLKPLYDAGYRNLIAIDIRETLAKTYREFDTSDANIVVIKHKKQLGSVLDFTNELILERITMGYFDAKRAFGKYIGSIYPVKPDSAYLDSGITQNELRSLLDDDLASGIIRKERAMLKILSYIDSFEAFEYNVSVHSKEFYTGMLEVLAELLNIPENKEYCFNDFNKAVADKIAEIEELSKEEHIILESIKSKVESKDFSFDDESLKAVLAYALKHKEKLEPVLELFIQSSPRLAAAYLCSVLVSNRAQDNKE